MPGLDTLLGLFLGDQGATPNPLYKKNLDMDEEGNFLHPDTGAIVPDSVANQPYNTPSFWTKMLHPDVAQQEFAYNNQPYNASVANDITRSENARKFGLIAPYIGSQINSGMPASVAGSFLNGDVSPQNILGANRSQANTSLGLPSLEAQNQWLSGISSGRGLASDLFNNNPELGSQARNVGLQYDIASNKANMSNISPIASLALDNAKRQLAANPVEFGARMAQAQKESDVAPYATAASIAQDKYAAGTIPLQQDIDTSRLGQQRSDLPFANSAAHKAAIANSYLSGFTSSPPLFGGHINPDSTVSLGYNKGAVPESMQALGWMQQGGMNKGSGGSTITLSNGKTVQIPPSSNTYDALSGQPILAPPIQTPTRSTQGSQIQSTLLKPQTQYSNIQGPVFEPTETDNKFWNIRDNLPSEARTQVMSSFVDQLEKNLPIPSNEINAYRASHFIPGNPKKGIIMDAMALGKGGSFSKQDIMTMFMQLPQETREQIYKKSLSKIGEHVMGSAHTPTQ